MLTKKPYLRLVKYISVLSVLLMLLACFNSFLTTRAEPPEGGLVLLDPDQSSSPRTPDKQEVEDGVYISLEAVANEGFQFSHWRETDETSPIINVRVKGDRTRTAVFVPNAVVLIPDPTKFVPPKPLLTATPEPLPT
ncbi:MAG: hypothetical protein IIB29_17400, partial [Chloroflexi bacterium]|nr:hypothetical protein [Chloroflexota bacterium]